MNTIQKSLLGSALLVAFAVYSGAVIIDQIQSASLEASSISAFVGPVQAKNIPANPAISIAIIKQPSNLKAWAAQVDNKPVAKLTWSDNANNENGYWVRRSKSMNDADVKNADYFKLPANTTSYTDKTVKEGETWFYRVKVTTSDATSSAKLPDDVWTNWQSVTIPAVRPSALKVFEDGKSTDSKPVLELNWTDNSSVETGYRIYRATDGTSNKSKIADIAKNSTSYHDNTIKLKQAYNYQVCAVAPGGESCSSFRGATLFPDDN